MIQGYPRYKLEASKIGMLDVACPPQVRVEKW